MADDLIDLAALAKLMEMIDGDEDDLAEFIGDFTDISADLVGNMKTAQISQDWDSFRIAAHTLKSNARDLGANTLSDLAGTLEKACRVVPVDITKEQVATIEHLRGDAVTALTLVSFDTLEI